MKLLLITSYFCMLPLVLTLWADENILQDPTTNPAISKRCKKLLKKREKKIKVRQKTQSLIRRNNLLLEKTQKKQKTTRNKLLSISRRLKHKLILSNLEINSEEEHIVRNGCPGITLQK